MMRRKSESAVPFCSCRQSCQQANDADRIKDTLCRDENNINARYDDVCDYCVGVNDVRESRHVTENPISPGDFS